jgi:eukaryotic-like serine/threonine-protein kinase
MTKLYGAEPVFIFDPNDHSNEPVPGLHDNALAFWPIYPQFLRDLFIQSFTAGIRDPENGRVRESQWREAMSQLGDWLVYCGSCGMENFYDNQKMKTYQRQLGPCWSCAQPVSPPPRLRLNNRALVMLNHNRRLFPHHLDSEKMYDFSAPAAEVTQHPKEPKIWGLKNLSSDKWVVTTAKNVVSDVAPGRSFSLAEGTKIRFGAAEGEIRL